MSERTSSAGTEPEFVTTAYAAELGKVTLNGARRWVESRRIPGTIRGRGAQGHKIPLKALLAFLAIRDTRYALPTADEVLAALAAQESR